MQAHNKPSGFSTFEAIIALLVIAAIALSGWYFWQRRQNDTPDNSQRTQSTEEQVATDEPKNRYLIINEWGVKIPLNDDISGAYYEYNSSRDNSVSSIALHDATFDALLNSNGEPCGEYTFYAISRAKSEVVPEITNPESNLYDGPPAPYREFSFTDEYQFGGLGQHQAGPSCLMLESDSDQASESNRKVMEAVNAKEQAFDTAFNQLQPVE